MPWAGWEEGEGKPGGKARQAEGRASPGPEVCSQEVCSQEASEAAGRELVGWLTQAWGERVAQWGLLRGGRHSDGILSALGSCCAVCSLSGIETTFLKLQEGQNIFLALPLSPSLRPQTQMLFVQGALSP